MDVAPPVGMTQLRVLESTRVTRSIDADLYTFDDDSTYFAAVYRPGARMLWELREAMGEATFDLALRDYITTFAHRTATPRSLLDLLQRHTDVKLNPIVNRYVTYGAFTYPQAQLWSASLVDTSLLVSTPLRILADFPIGPIEVWLDSQLLVSTDLGGDQDGIVMLDLRGSPRGEHVLLTKIWNSELAQFEQAIRVTVR
jgi:hypothetical protein